MLTFWIALVLLAVGLRLEAVADEERVTVRQFISWLTEAAEDLPEGLDSEIDLTICDRRGKQFIDHVEVEPWRMYSAETGQEVPEGPRGVYIVGHWHPNRPLASTTML